jgi:Tol biopolymer transport system component
MFPSAKCFRFSVLIVVIGIAAVISPQAGSLAGAAEKTPGDEKEKAELPLTPGRTLEYTATEGTWISLDVSPDGRTIVFDLLGDLYTLPLAGGVATRITHGMPFDAQPRFSPDGKQVVFVSDENGSDNVWLLDLETNKRRALTKGKTENYVSPEWTPDGEYLVVSRSSGVFQPPGLWLIHVDGGSGTQLIKTPGDEEKPRQQKTKTLGASFGDDPRYIWYAQRTGDWQYNAALPQFQLARYDRDEGKSVVMTSRQGSAMRPALSPDGKLLAYATRYDHETGLRLRELDTGAERWLAYPVQRDDQEARATLDAFPGYSFTPDSREVVVSYGGEIWRVPVDGSEATRVDFSAGVALDLGDEVRFDYRIDTEPTFVARQIRGAVPSPDGGQVAFTALDQLWVMELDGEPKRLGVSEAGQHFPAWSPDGKWIAYVTWSDPDGGFIYKTRADGRGAPVRLTDASGLYTHTAWSPDGERIVAIRTSARDLQESTGYFVGGLAAEFVHVPAGGGELTVIGPTEGRTDPHFTDDPERIYAYSSGEGLLSMRWDGTDVKAHVKVTGAKLPGESEPESASRILMAPAGDQAVAQVGHHLYTVTVPYVGGETPTISITDPAKASFPATKLTEIGGQFPVWSRDARTVHWSIGNAFVTFDLERARAFKDSVKQAAKQDTTAARSDEKADDKKKPARYQPDERRIEITAERDLPSGEVVLQGARVITMKGREIIDDAEILVRDNRIIAVGPRGQIERPGTARVIDVSGKTIIPGFVDTHSHMWPAWNIHNTQVWLYLANLAYGVTTTRDPQTSTTDVLTYSDLVETGALIGPRIYSTGPGVFWDEPIEDLDHARNVLRRYSDYYDTKTFKMYMTGNREQRQWLIMAARELELMPTTEGGIDYKLDLTHAMDGYPGLEHSFPITPIYGDVVELFVKTGITHTPTLLVSFGGPFGENFYYTTEEVYDNPKLRRFTPYTELAEKALRRGRSADRFINGWYHPQEHVFQRHARFAADLIEAGGRVGVGSHGQLQGLGYHWELWSVQSGGMSEHDALRAATILGAEAIGFGDDVGSIEPGKLADMIVLDRDPLENIRNSDTILYVMKNGRIYEGETLKEIWPRERDLPTQHWRDGWPVTRAGMR